MKTSVRHHHPRPFQTMPITLPELETDRLRIREVADFDLEDLMSINGDPEVTKFLPYATWASIEDAAAWLSRMQALQATGSGIQLVIYDKSANLVVGTVLLKAPHMTPTFTVFWLLSGRRVLPNQVINNAPSAALVRNGVMSLNLAPGRV